VLLALVIFFCWSFLPCFRRPEADFLLEDLLFLSALVFRSFVLERSLENQELLVLAFSWGAGFDGVLDRFVFLSFVSIVAEPVSNEQM